MKPEDQKALLSAWAKINHHNGDHDWVTYMLGWQAALAHRDAQPAVAVNEQLLMALVMITDTIPFQFMGEVERDLTLSAIAAAKKELGK